MTRLRARTLREQVEQLADRRCEYCRAPQAVCGYRFHLDHIIPVSRSGGSDLSNRALACATCNLAKSDRVSAVDPDSGNEVPLFHPREQKWSDHFRWIENRTVEGRTATGRATVDALNMNNEKHLIARQLWFETGWLQ